MVGLANRVLWGIKCTGTELVLASAQLRVSAFVTALSS